MPAQYCEGDIGTDSKEVAMHILYRYPRHQIFDSTCTLNSRRCRRCNTDGDGKTCLRHLHSYI